VSRDVVYKEPEGFHKKRDHRHPSRKLYQPRGDDGGHTQDGYPDLVPQAGGAADADLLREMITTFAGALMNAEVDSLCGAGYGSGQRNG
jgi:hypothetical protein